MEWFYEQEALKALSGFLDRSKHRALALHLRPDWWPHIELALVDPYSWRARAITLQDREHELPSHAAVSCFLFDLKQIKYNVSFKSFAIKQK